MSSRPMIDSSTPPPASVAKRWIHKYGIKAHGIYLPSPFVISSNEWTPQLAEEYRQADIRQFMTIYVGQQMGEGLGNGTFTEGQGLHDGHDAVSQAKRFGFHPGRIARTLGFRPHHIALDVEEETFANADSGSLHAYIKGFCAAVKNHAGFAPGVYGTPAMGHLLEGTSCSFFWIAAYFQDVGGSLMPHLKADSVGGVDSRLFRRRRAWQYAGDALLDGEQVDLNTINFHLASSKPFKHPPEPKPRKHRKPHGKGWLLPENIGRFVRNNQGKYLWKDGVFGSNSLGAQCVNLCNRWAQALGIEPFPNDAGDFQFESHPDCVWVDNKPDNHPSPGDIVIWSKALVPPFGHCDVAIHGSKIGFLGFDQNYGPEGTPCHRQLHDYQFVAGWLHPKDSLFE